MPEQPGQPNALDAHQSIEAFAHRRDLLGDCHLIDKMAIGEFIRQGDIYCLRIEHPADGWIPTYEYDLASKGMPLGRHTVKGRSVELYIPPVGHEAVQGDRVIDRHESLRLSLASVMMLHRSMGEFLHEYGLIDDLFRRTPILYGPQIIAKDRICIMHPRHAHFILPEGVYQVSYQLDLGQDTPVID